MIIKVYAMMSADVIIRVVLLVLRRSHDVSPLRASSGGEVRCLAQADGSRGSHAFYLMVQRASSRCWTTCGFVNYLFRPSGVRDRIISIHRLSVRLLYSLSLPMDLLYYHYF